MYPIRLGPGDFDIIMIFNLQGCLIRSFNLKELNTSKDQDCILDLHDIPPGLYLVEAFNKMNSLTEKIIVY